MADCNVTEVFLGEWERMCHKGDCPTCCLSSYNNMTESKLTCNQFIKCCPQEAIEIVQKWSDENPIKTRLSMFLEMFPNAEIADDGMPYIYPCKLDANYEFSEDCKEFLGGFRCGMCKKEYWLSEVE